MQCRIQFIDRNLDQFQWCKFDEVAARVTDCGIAEIDELRAICSGAGKTIVFLPQQDIFLTSVNLPPRANKQQLNAIAYAVEEQLAGDIDDCFFANLPQQADHSVPLAVVNRDLMDEVVTILAQHHLNVRLILPQAYLCPWPDDAELLASVCPLEQGYLIRYGRHAGLFCVKAILPATLELLARRAETGRQRIDFYADDMPAELEQSDLVIQRFGRIDPLSQDVESTTCLNLKQKEYQSTHAWVELVKRWKWPAVALVLLSLTLLTSNLFELWEKEKNYQQLVSEQQQLLAQYLPDLEPSDQPKKQLIQQLAGSQGGQGQTGFVDLLYEYSSLKSAFTKISTKKIVYQQAKLVVSLESSDLRSVESLREKLATSQFAAQLENVNINPDITTGRLVMKVP